MKIFHILPNLFFISIFGLAGCVTETPQVDESKLTVATSFYIPEHFVTKVGGEYVNIISAPTGAGGHNYSPTPQEVSQLLAADVFIYQGKSFDPWAEKLVSDFEANDAIVLTMTDHVTLREFSDEDQPNENKTGQYDPHTWVDPVLAINMVNMIADTLIAADPNRATDYRSNASAFVSGLAALDEAYQMGLAQCNQNTIIVAHDAFVYPAARYDFEVEAIAGFSPDVLPSAKRLAELSDIISDHDLKYIFFETLTSPDITDTLASDAGVETLVLNPVEGLTAEQLERSEDYISIMYDNLENLQLALDCQT